MTEAQFEIVQREILRRSFNQMASARFSKNPAVRNYDLMGSGPTLRAACLHRLDNLITLDNLQHASSEGRPPW